jgi:hypothetical protein
LNFKSEIQHMSNIYMCGYTGWIELLSEIQHTPYIYG